MPLKIIIAVVLLNPVLGGVIAQESPVQVYAGGGALQYLGKTQGFNGAVNVGVFAPQLTFPSGGELAWSTYNTQELYEPSMMNPDLTQRSYKVQYFDVHLYLATHNLLQKQTQLRLTTGPVFNRMVKYEAVNTYSNGLDSTLVTLPLSSKWAWSWRIGVSCERPMGNWGYLRLALRQDVRLKSIYPQSSNPTKYIPGSTQPLPTPIEKMLVFGIDIGWGIYLFKTEYKRS